MNAACVVMLRAVHHLHGAVYTREWASVFHVARARSRDLGDLYMEMSAGETDSFQVMSYVSKAVDCGVVSGRDRLLKFLAEKHVETRASNKAAKKSSVPVTRHTAESLAKMKKWGFLPLGDGQVGSESKGFYKDQNSSRWLVVGGALVAKEGWKPMNIINI